MKRWEELFNGGIDWGSNIFSEVILKEFLRLDVSWAAEQEQLKKAMSKTLPVFFAEVKKKTLYWMRDVPESLWKKMEETVFIWTKYIFCSIEGRVTLFEDGSKKEQMNIWC